MSLYFFCLTLSLTAQVSIIDNNQRFATPQKIKNLTIIPVSYDTLQSVVLIDDVNFNKRFIGQKLFLPPSNRRVTLYKTRFDSIFCESVNYQQSGLKGCNRNVKLWTNSYIPTNLLALAQSNRIIYPNAEFSTSSLFLDSIKNRYYTITNVYDNEASNRLKNKIADRIEFLEQLNQNVDGVSCKYPTIELRDDITGDTLYYSSSQNGDNVIYDGITYSNTYGTNEFISVGVYAKLKRLYEGKNLIWYLGGSNGYGYEIDDDDNTIIDLISNNTYSKKEIGAKFKCVAIKLYNVGESNLIVASLKNDKGEIVLSCSNNLSDIKYHFDLFNHNLEFCNYIFPKLHQSIGKFILEDDVIAIEKDKEYKKLIARKSYDPKEDRLNECIKLYGRKNGTLIANYTVSIGMTKAMCESAGFRFDSSMTTKQGKTIILRNASQRAILVNGIVSKIYNF